MATTFRVRCFVAAVAALIGVAQQVRADSLGTAFTYQGQLKQNGIPANGPFALVFTLWDALGSGNPPIGGTQIGSPVTVNLSAAEIDNNGSFMVQVNEANEFGGTAFIGDARWVEISVNGTPLSPRQPITAAPYALGLRPGARVQGSDSLFAEFANPLTQQGLQAQGLNFGVYAFSTGQPGGTGVFALGNYGLRAQGHIRAVEGQALSPAAWAGYFEGKSFFSDRVGIGTDAPGAKLEVSNSCNIGCPDLLYLTALYDGITRRMVLNASSINTTGSSASLPLYLNDQTAGHVVLANGGGNVGIGIWPPTQKLDVAGMVRSSLGGYMFPDGTVQTTAALGGPNFWSAGGDDIFNLNTGKVGIGFSSPGAMLDVRRPGDSGYVYPVARFSTLVPRTNPVQRSDITFNYTSINATSEAGGIPMDATLKLNDTSSGDVLLAYGGGRVGIGIVPFYNGTKLHVVGQTTGVRGEATDDSSYGVFGTSPDIGVFGYGETGVEGWPSSASGYGGVFGNNLFPNALKTLGDVHMLLGNVGIGSTDPDSKLKVLANSGDHLADFTQLGGGDGMLVKILEATNPHPALVVQTLNGDVPTLEVVGVARVSVLEITGADVAEKFPTSEQPGTIKPGVVMEIDSNNAGKLRIARGAYNRRVAGVVSGAGDLKAGTILGNMPGYEDAPPIALSGRVWVHCDASTVAIEPGDLLTTSETAGHAMKVTDFPRAQGAIIGKAMTALDRGQRGLVLVLVSLQ